MAAVTQPLGIVTTGLGALTALISIKNFKVAITAEKHQTMDENGNVMADDDTYYREKHTVTADGTMLIAYSQPSIGDTLSLNSVDYKIDEFEEAETNEDKPQFSLTASMDVEST